MVEKQGSGWLLLILCRWCQYCLFGRVVFDIISVVFSSFVCVSSVLMWVKWLQIFISIRLLCWCSVVVMFVFGVVQEIIVSDCCFMVSGVFVCVVMVVKEVMSGIIFSYFGQLICCSRKIQVLNNMVLLRVINLICLFVVIFWVSVVVMLFYIVFFFVLLVFIGKWQQWIFVCVFRYLCMMESVRLLLFLWLVGVYSIFSWLRICVVCMVIRLVVFGLLFRVYSLLFMLFFLLCCLVLVVDG